MAMQQASAGGSSASGRFSRLESRSERRVDAMVHVVGLTLALIASVVLAMAALPAEAATDVLSVALYAAGLLAMLSCSALYNMAGDGPGKAFRRRLDHAAIFVMIAGTYTPFLAIAIGGTWGTGLLIFVWMVAAAGAVLKLLHPGWRETLSIAAYLLLGWTILVAIDRLIAAVSLAALILLAGGGVLYTIGVVFHQWERLPYQRAIWHGFVLMAAACHYFAILEVLAA